MFDYFLEKKYYITSSMGFRYVIEEGDDDQLINIRYQEKNRDNDWDSGELLIENMSVETLPKLVEVLNDIIKDKLRN